MRSGLAVTVTKTNWQFSDIWHCDTEHERCDLSMFNHKIQWQCASFAYPSCRCRPRRPYGDKLKLKSQIIREDKAKILPIYILIQAAWQVFRWPSFTTWRHRRCCHQAGVLVSSVSWFSWLDPMAPEELSEVCRKVAYLAGSIPCQVVTFLFLEIQHLLAIHAR